MKSCAVAPKAAPSACIDRMTSPSVRPRIVHEDGVTVVVFGPDFERISEDRIAAVSETLLQAAEANPPRVVLDLSGTKFFSSSFIEVVFRLWNRLQTRQGSRFALAGVDRYCAEILQVTNLDHLWKLYPTRVEALRAVNS
jgi:anti-anti-sigma factor